MRKWLGSIVATVVLAAIGASATEGQVGYRQHTMAAVGGHMQAIVDIIRGNVMHTDHLPIHANAMADLAELAPTLFPEGSQGGNALEAIWQNGEDFQAKLAAFKDATSQFKAAAATGDMATVRPAFLAVGQACKGCHDDYRAE